MVTLLQLVRGPMHLNRYEIQSEKYECLFQTIYRTKNFKKPMTVLGFLCQELGM